VNKFQSAEICILKFVQALKNRLLNFHGTLMTNYKLNLFWFTWLSMTKMKKLLVEFCLET